MLSPVQGDAALVKIQKQFTFKKKLPKRVPI